MPVSSKVNLFIIFVLQVKMIFVFVGGRGRRCGAVEERRSLSIRHFCQSSVFVDFSILTDFISSTTTNGEKLLPNLTFLHITVYYSIEEV